MMAQLHSGAMPLTCHAQYQGPATGRTTWDAAIIKNRYTIFKSGILKQWSGACSDIETVFVHTGQYEEEIRS